MPLHIATAAVVKVSIGSASGNRVARFITRGDIVPEGVAKEQLERLVSRGLIAPLEADLESVPEVTPAVQTPVTGEPQGSAPADAGTADASTADAGTADAGKGRRGR